MSQRTAQFTMLIVICIFDRCHSRLLKMVPYSKACNVYAVLFTFYSNYDRTPGEGKGGRGRRGKGRGREGRRSQPPPNKIMMMMKQGLDAICLKVVLYSVVISKVL